MMLLRGRGGAGATASSFRCSSRPSLARPPSVVARASSSPSSSSSPSCYYSTSSRATPPTGVAVAAITPGAATTHRRRRRDAASSFARARATSSSSSGDGNGGSGGDEAAAAAAAASAAAPPATPEEAYAILGLDPASVRTFEDVVAAKDKAFAAAAAAGGGGGGAEAEAQRARAEAAYDLLFMRDMRRRLSGETAVSASVRYADVAPAPRRGPGSGGGKGGGGGAAAKAKDGGGGLGAFFGGGGGKGGSSSSSAPVRGIRAGSSSSGRASSSSSSSPSMVAVRPVAGEQAAQLAAVFGGLAALALAAALLETPEAQARDVAALPLALAGAFSVYSLRGAPKRLSLARASVITALAAGLGVAGGTLLNAWLRVDILPLGAFASPGVLSADAAILAIWAACALLE